MLYNKLVRDRIPEIIRADGRMPVTRTLKRNYSWKGQSSNSN